MEVGGRFPAWRFPLSNLAQISLGWEIGFPVPLLRRYRVLMSTAQHLLGTSDGYAPQRRATSDARLWIWTDGSFHSASSVGGQSETMSGFIVRGA